MASIAIAGATGRLGQLIAGALRERGATVRALVRPGTAPERLRGLSGAAIVEADYSDPASLNRALAGTDVVVSALNGLRDIIVTAQAALLDAAVANRVGRFIPSDYAADIFRLAAGENRNFDLRREFRTGHLQQAPIASTSILVGGFMELLLRGRMIDFAAHAVNYWGSPEQPLDYTTMADTARIAAAVALDPHAPDILRISGDRITARQVAAAAGEVLGTPFALNRLGSVEELAALIAGERAAHPEAESEVFPRFQQLQYTHNMQSGRGTLEPLDPPRYDLKLTTVRQLLAANAAQLRAPQP
ncbi:MAG TPA: NmrA family NAD(P)-binding protein [Devosia sp.]|nr:NmrA family NAD(P)-binding protein [Devosia sp.]